MYNEYFKLKDSEKELQVNIDYKKDARIRGYYLDIVPVRKKEEEINGRKYYSIMVSMSDMFGAPRILLKEVKRRTPKADEEALSIGKAIVLEKVAEEAKRLGKELQNEINN